MAIEQTGDTGSAETSGESQQDLDLGQQSVDSGANGADAGGMDISAAVDQIGADLFGKEPDSDASDAAEEQTASDEPSVDDTPEQPEIEAIAPPQSWAKDKHEHWSKMPREAQEYYLQREKQMLDGLEQYKEAATFGRPLKDVILPYMPMIQARGIDAPKAIAALLNAQHQLDTNPEAGLLQIAKSYGIDLGKLAQAAGAQPEQVDPRVAALEKELTGIKSTLTASQQQAYEAAKTKVSAEVSAFASDPAHQYFDEVSEDIVKLLQTGETLEKAYEKAVWANPVTRAKELARVQKEQSAKLREKSVAAAAAAKKAASSNVRSRDTRRAPTELVGTMEDTMKETLAQLKAKVH